MAKATLTGDPKQIFMSAVSFHVGSSILYDDSLRRMHQAIYCTSGFMLPCLWPSIVCGAFSLELYLKCFLVLERGSFPQSHGLHELFNELPVSRQDRIQEIFAHVLKESPEQASLATELAVSLDFTDIITKADDAFRRMRYVFDGIDTDCDFRAGFVQIALLRAILEVKPEWNEYVQAQDASFTHIPMSTASGQARVITRVREGFWQWLLRSARRAAGLDRDK